MFVLGLLLIVVINKSLLLFVIALIMFLLLAILHKSLMFIGQHYFNCIQQCHLHLHIKIVAHLVGL